MPQPPNSDPAGQPNPYDSVVSDINTGAAAVGARASVMSVADRNPDAEAQVQRQAASLGVPYESARNNPTAITQRAAAGAVDYDNLARQAPVTTRYLANPANAAVSHDDVGVLGSIENWLGNQGQRVAAGLHSAVGIGAQALSDFYTNLPRLIDPLGLSQAGQAGFAGKSPIPTPQQHVQDEIAKARLAQHIGLQQFAVGQQQTAQRISQRAQLNAGTSDYSYLTLDPSKSAFLSPTKMVGDLAEGLPTLTALALSRGEGAAPIIGGYMGVGQQLDTLTNLRDGEVKKSPAYRSLVNAGVAPADALTYVKNSTASDQGVVSGVLNTALAGLAAKVPTGGSLWKGLGLDSMSWGAMGAASKLGENAVAKGDINSDQSLTEGVGEAFLSNALQGALFHGVTHSIGHALLADRRTTDAYETHEALSEFSDLASSSKTRDRDGERFSNLVAEMTDGSPVQAVYVSASAIVRALLGGERVTA